MVLNNVTPVLTDSPVSIRISEGKISRVLPKPFYDTDETYTLQFDNAAVFPGLINSHDHLDFNLFPALGNKKYQNYTEWGKYIHQNYKEDISKVLKVPVALREQWGMYKNLLCGVTTVVNHGKKLKRPTNIISVYENCHSIHSVQFEKKWKLSLNNPLKKNIPVVIHTGEGTDELSSHEISKLNRWNILHREMIGVHGIAMSNEHAKAFKALVWCPESNSFMFGQTAAVNELKTHTRILFGTDSTLTGSWNLWDHIRLARETGYLTDQELLDSLTINAAWIWKLDSGEIAPGREADITIARKRSGTQSIFDLNPNDILLVLHKGCISLFDEELYPQLKGIQLEHYSRIYINGTCKYVKGNLPALMQKIKQYYQEAIFPVI